jgi:hypothetical protein
VADEKGGSGSVGRNVVLGESSPECVLAAVSLVRRIPGGADLFFGTREKLPAALAIPAHKNRERPYRLHVVGPDLPPGSHDATLAAFHADPAVSLHWYDANVWTPAGGAEINALCTKNGSWFNDTRTHHPFPAVDAASEPLNLAPDPFALVLRAMAEQTLSAADDEAFGRAWRDALDFLSTAPLELVDSVRPLIHGMPLEIGVIDRGEGEALRAELAGLVANSRLMRVPVRETELGQAVLLVLPGSGRIPPAAIAREALNACPEAGLAFVAFDRGDRVYLQARHRGAEPPLDVRATFERLLELPFAQRDRLRRGSASVLLVDPPKNALEQLVSRLL